MKDLVIRKGNINDLESIHQLIVELAIYEKAPNEVSNTVEKMKEDGFGEKPVFIFFVAELNGIIIGMALCYYRYSTWKGKRLYLEDLIVTEKYRQNGIGTALFEAVLNKAKAEICTGITWQVLDWNKPAIQFYKKYNTNFESGWVNCNLAIQ